MNKFCIEKKNKLKFKENEGERKRERDMYTVIRFMLCYEFVSLFVLCEPNTYSFNVYVILRKEALIEN